MANYAKQQKQEDMCGFAGIVSLVPSPPDLMVLKKMGEKLAHRGPDDEGCFLDEGIGFFHKRLSIIDLVQGHQPMTFNGKTIVFNGEIYNYLELRKTLQSKGVEFQTNSDTEVILRMYEFWGEKCVDLLNGMFAFMIYDPDNSRVFIARDHFGIKPLYYFVDNAQYLFASEIKALLVHPAVKACPNYESIHEYLTFQFVLGEKTMFQGIYKILPGHYAVIHTKTLKIRHVLYWEPDFVVDFTTRNSIFRIKSVNCCTMRFECS